MLVDAQARHRLAALHIGRFRRSVLRIGHLREIVVGILADENARLIDGRLDVVLSSARERMSSPTESSATPSNEASTLAGQSGFS